MSHALRRMQRQNMNRVHRITHEELSSYWRTERLPTPQQQADYLILWIGDHQVSPESYANDTWAAIAAWVGCNLPEQITDLGRPVERGLEWLLNQIKPLYECVDDQYTKLAIRLTIDGWQRYAQLKKANVESRIAFMAMKFGQPELNRVVDECIRLAVRRTGFDLRLVTDQQPAGIIDDQMRAAILASRFVISDLTHDSAGAYWEAGFGEGLGLPVLYTCETSKWEERATHFDTNHLVTITWDLAALKKTEDKLAATIRATLRAEAKQTDD